MFRITQPSLGARACDHFGHVTPAQCDALRSDGFEGIFLYAEVVNADDLNAATGAGLWVGFVLEGLSATTRPTSALGAQIATVGIGRIRALGVPPGLTVFSDLEGEGRASADWIAFANGAGDATTALGDIAGAYVGEGIGLTSAELYGLHVHRYWKSGSRVVDRNGQLAEPSCGWCVVQGMPFDIARAGGLSIDVDVVWQDYARRMPSVLSATAAVDAAA